MAPLGHKDASQTNAQDDLMRSLGLHRKRVPYSYRSGDDMNSHKQINIPSGVEMKDCSVVILGEMCSICGQPFKCITDVTIHTRWRHPAQATHDGSESVKRSKIVKANNGEMLIGFDLLKKCYERFKKDVRRRRSHKDTHTRIILKIGEEILSAIDLDRKHLRNYSFDLRSNASCDTKYKFRNKGTVRSPYAISAVTEERSTADSTAVTAALTNDTSINGTHDSSRCEFTNVQNAEGSNRRVSVQRIATQTQTQTQMQTIHDESVKNGKEKGQLSTSNINICKSVNEHDKENRYRENVRYGNVFGEEEEEEATLNWRRSPVRRAGSVEDADSSSALQLKSENIQEVMEILRIVRRRYDTEEINHESPSRRERNLLALDGVRETSNVIQPKRSAKVSLFEGFGDTNETTACEFDSNDDRTLTDCTIAEIDRFLLEVDREINLSGKPKFVDYTELLKYTGLLHEEDATRPVADPVVIDLAYDSD